MPSGTCISVEPDFEPVFHTGLLYREPLQYLCNVAHWRDITLAVGAGVLIPRPETEQLIDLTQEVRTRGCEYTCPSGYQRSYPCLLALHGDVLTVGKLLLIIWLGQAFLLHPELREGTWADLGTGSGALAIGLASILLPGSRVLAVDCSASARDWANLNVQRLGLAASVQVHTCMAMLGLLVAQNPYP